MKRTLFPAVLAATLAMPAWAAPETIAIMDIPPESFVAKAASANAFEIRSSELAGEKGRNAEVKTFAQQMVADHTKAAEELKAAAGLTPVPEAMAPRDAAKIALLEGAEGDEFDRLYTDMQAAAHAEAVSLFAAYAQHGSDAGLRAFAAATLPTLEGHRTHIGKIVASP